MISGGSRIGRFRLVAVFGWAGAVTVLVAAVFGFGAVAVSLAKGGEGPRTQEKTIVETNQPALARPLGPISTEEAEAALKRIKTPEAGAGTWRKMDVMDDTTTLHTNIVYQWQGPDGKKLERRERIQQIQSKGKEAKFPPRRSLWVGNEEGLWAVHERVAILRPGSGGAHGTNGVVTSGTTTNGAASGKAGKSAKDEDEFIDENDPEIAADTTTVGERLKEGDRVALLISKRMGPKAQKRVEVLIEQKIKEMKKEIPLLLRPLLTVSFIKGMIAKLLPMRFDQMMDEETNMQILERGYNKDGRFIMEERAWAPCPDLAPESYAVPKNLKLLRPKTQKEAEKLEEDARKEDEKIREKKK